VRWYQGTGEVDQVYVAPTQRRQGIGSDGQRTALGDRWRSTSDWAHRTAPLNHLAPPMTPLDQR
jgi:hypothetical protein